MTDEAFPLRRPEEFAAARAVVVKLFALLPVILDALRIAEDIARREYIDAG